MIDDVASFGDNASGWLSELRLTETLGSMPDVQIIVIGLVGIALAAYPVTWQVMGYPVTIAHELGHATAALLVGYRLDGITVNGDMSGATNFAGRGAFRMLWTMWWGYPAPAVLGGGLVWAAANGWSRVALGVLVILLTMTFLYSRSWHTVGVVLATGLVLGLICWYGSPWAQNAVVFASAWMLIVGSVRAFWTVARLHVTRDGVENSDAYMMGQRAVLLPGPFWLLTFAAAIGSSAWFGVTRVAGALGV